MSFWDTTATTESSPTENTDTTVQSSFFGLPKQETPATLPVTKTTSITKPTPNVLTPQKEDIKKGTFTFFNELAQPIIREGTSLVKGSAAVAKDVIGRTKEAAQKGDFWGAFDTASIIPHSIKEAKQRFNVFTGAESTPESQITQNLTGTDKPFSLQTEGKGIAKSFGFDVNNPTLAGGIGLLSAGLDFTPFGGEKNAVKELVKANTAEDAARHLRTLGVADSHVSELANNLISFKNEADKQKFVDNLITTIKGESKSTPPPVATPEISPYQETGDLTTKVLKDLEGKTTVSKQYILDATNRGELKQSERDILRNVLGTEGDKVNVPEFAKKVQAELLPLERVASHERDIKTGHTVTEGTRSSPKYESIALPNDLRGSVKNYSENIYNSPIKTSAGNVHFSGVKGKDNYFGHTRIEDMADNSTRRVIEVQSDLYQKGNLGKEEIVKTEDFIKALSPEEKKFMTELAKDPKRTFWNDMPRELFAKMRPYGLADETVFQLAKDGFPSKANEVAKLQQYTDPTAHFRMVREEVKKAAEDGKTKLQFPTGETAMKIEGLGQDHTWFDMSTGEAPDPANLKVGQLVQDGSDKAWVITDVLGDGKFKAVDKFYVDNQPKNWEFNVDKSIKGKTSWRATNKVTGRHEFTEFIPSKKQEALDFLKRRVGADNPDISLQEIGSRHGEQFDISGKVDTNNPIYKFYEKDLGRYLKNKYNAEIVTDSKGVKWYQIAINATHKAPVEVFGAFGGFSQDENGNITYDPVKGALGAIGIGVINRNRPELLKALEENKAKIDMTEQGIHSLENSYDIAKLGKFISKTGEFKGELNINNGTGKFGKNGDTILREIFNDNNNKYTSEELIAKYNSLHDALKSAKENLKSLNGEQKAINLALKEVDKNPEGYALINAKNVDEASTVLSNMGFSDASIPGIAGSIIDIKDVGAREKFINAFLKKNYKDVAESPKFKNLATVTDGGQYESPRGRPEITPAMQEKVNTANRNATERYLAQNEKIAKQNRMIEQKRAYSIIPEKPTFFGKLGQALAPIKGLEKDTQATFRKWDTAIKKSKILANRELDSFKIPKGETSRVIDSYELGNHTAYNPIIRDKFNALHDEAVARGLDTPYKANYIPHVYAQSPQEISDKIREYLLKNGLTTDEAAAYMNGGRLAPDNVKRLGLNPFFIKERTIPTYAEARQYGLTPRYNDLNQLAAHYRENLERNVANRDFIEKLVESNKLRLPQYAPDNWQAINLSFAPKGYYAEPKLAKTLNEMFRDEDALGFGAGLIKFVADLSKKAQEITLSAGLPFTNVNFFSIGQTIKQMTAGDFKSVMPFLRANFNEASIRFFRDNQKTMEQMAEEGIDLGGTIASYKNLYPNLVEKWSPEALKNTDKKGLYHLLGETFDKAFNEKTFGSFMPQMHIQYFKDTLDEALKEGLSNEEARKLAGDTTKAMFGIIDDAGRAQGTKDQLSALFFAPHFREGILNTLFNTGKSAFNLGAYLLGKAKLDPKLEGNRKLFAGMVFTYGVYNALNKQLTGHYMWDNTDGKQFALQIPYGNGDNSIYIEFMPSFLAFARNLTAGGIALAKGDLSSATQKIGSVFSMPIKIIAEIVGNSDYFGRKIYKDTDTGAQKTFKIAKYIGLSVNHPYISELAKAMEDKQPLWQALLKMSELPVKFGNKKQESTNEYYNALIELQKKQAQEKEKFRKTFDEIQKLKDSGNQAEADRRVNELSDEDYAVYKSFRTSARRADTIKAEREMYSIYNKVQNLKASGNNEEAQAIIDDMSDEEYKAYDTLRNKFKKKDTSQ